MMDTIATLLYGTTMIMIMRTLWIHQQQTNRLDSIIWSQGFQGSGDVVWLRAGILDAEYIVLANLTRSFISNLCLRVCVILINHCLVAFAFPMATQTDIPSGLTNDDKAFLFQLLDAQLNPGILYALLHGEQRCSVSVLTCRCWLMSGIYTGILVVTLWNICESGSYLQQHLAEPNGTRIHSFVLHFEPGP